MQQNRIGIGVIVFALAVGAAGSTDAAFPKGPVTKCPTDSVVAGTACLDKYEASVWRVPNATTSNASLVKKIQKGMATAADLAVGGAAQLGTASDNYGPCTDNGQNCADDIYAVSLPGVTPAAYLTWFQAQEACANAGKRLPTSAEWQVAVTGSPDPGSDNGTTDCNTNSTMAVTSSGSRTSCVSAVGAFDMVGNLSELTADSLPASAFCVGWDTFSNDYMCLAGTNTTAVSPGALLRGGSFLHASGAGPFTVIGLYWLSSSSDDVGFRCAR